MNISNFDDLLIAARAQSQPQRLLLVFADIELPEDATVAERERFDHGEGGAFVPRTCVDKDPGELTSFAMLAKEAGELCQTWGMVFAAAMGGTADHPPTSEQAATLLQEMVGDIRAGRLRAYIPFDRRGEAMLIG
jgi:hypothetical protein